MKEKTKKLILFIALCVLTIFILIVALRINDNRKNNALSSSKISNYLTEVKYENINDYVSEEPVTVIYVSNSSDEKTINFDKLLIPIIRKYNLNSQIVYININNTNIQDPFYQNSPELVYYKDGKIIDLIDASTFNAEKEVIKWLKERSVIVD